MVKLGILDYAQIDEGSTATEALHDTVSLAKRAESLGYERFWVAEHHNVPAFASSSPEMVMMQLANATSSIRIGSGGVMIPHYSPYKVAENMRTLEAFHPNRVDLGIGNTVGIPLVNRALNENKQGKLPYEQSVADVQTYLNDDAGEEHRFHGITANPVIETKPQMWLLSASINNAKMAARRGLGYMVGLFPLAGLSKIEIATKAAHTYREQFVPSPFMKEPHVSIAPFVVIGETTEQAEQYAKALDIWLLGTDQFSKWKQFPSVKSAEKYQFSEAEQTMVQKNRNRMIVGNIGNVKKQLDALIDRFSADEVLIVPLIPGIDARKKAIELLAHAYS